MRCAIILWKSKFDQCSSFIQFVRLKNIFGIGFFHSKISHRQHKQIAIWHLHLTAFAFLGRLKLLFDSCLTKYATVLIPQWPSLFNLWPRLLRQRLPHKSCTGSRNVMFMPCDRPHLESLLTSGACLVVLYKSVGSKVSCRFVSNTGDSLIDLW